MNDLIYRQQAINAIMGLIEARLGWKSDASKEINGLNAAYCVIEDLPSAEPVRMKGKWLHVGRRRGMLIIANILGFFCIPIAAMKLNVEPKWVFLYLSIWCAGVMASDG